MKTLEGLKMRPKVCVTRSMPEEGVQLLRDYCDVVVGPEDRPFSTQGLIDAARHAHALVCFPSDRIDEVILAGCPQVQVVASFGKGYDNIDVEACTARGVWVTVSPDLPAEATADLAVGLMLALCRKIILGNAFMRSGQSPGWHPSRFLGQNLYGKVLGIVGLGAIGRAVARRAQGFSMPVLYYDYVALPEHLESELGVSGRPLSELLQEADVILLALPLTRQTFRLINRSRISSMKPSALLVNVSRGSIIDEEAVAEALVQQRLAGYAADVFAVEEQREFGRALSVTSGLLQACDQTVLTPHLGTATWETRSVLAIAVADNVLAALRGECPPGAINHVARRGMRPRSAKRWEERKHLSLVCE